MESIRIGVDAFPYKKDIWSICDYSGEQIYCKTALTLFCYHGSEHSLLAAEAYQQSRYKLHIKIKENLFWNNGDKVISKDFVRAMRYICMSKDNRYHKLLSSVNHRIGIMKAIRDVNDYQLTVETEWFDPFIPHYLTLINFSPRHAHKPSLSAGPYYIHETNKNTYKLKLNEYFNVKDKNKVNYVKEIIYCLIPEDKAALAYLRGDIQVSCDTALDLTLHKQSTGRQDFHHNMNTLAMLLSPGDRFNELTLEARCIISSAINVSGISSHYHHTLKPWFSWLSFYNQDYHPCEFSEIQPLVSPLYLMISYEDFYPNREILDYIAQDLSEQNIYVVLQKDDYGHWNSSAHFRLEIRKVPRNNPMQLIRSDLSRMNPSAPCYGKAKKVYSMLFNERFQHRHFELFSIIDSYLRQQLLYIPLFIFPTGFFCHHKLRIETLMCPDRYIELQGDLDAS